MSYNLNDFDHESGGGFGPYEATVIKAGAGISKYGPEILLVCKPTNPKRWTQNLHMSLGKGDFKFGGKQQVVTTGKGEKAFDVTVYDEIVSGPKIKVVSNGGLFLNALKHLGFEVASGDMTEYIGLKLDLEEISGNEAICRFNEIHSESKIDERTGDSAKGKITIPVRIITMPVKRVSLKDAVLEVIEGKTEEEMVSWYKSTDMYDGVATTPLYRVLSELEKTTVLIVNGKYLVKRDSAKEEEKE